MAVKLLLHVIKQEIKKAFLELFFLFLFSFSIEEYNDRSEWEIVESALIRNEKFYVCCEEPYPSIAMELTLKRRSTYYVMILLLLPTILIGCLSLLIFFLPPKSGK